jgi:amidase
VREPLEQARDIDAAVLDAARREAPAWKQRIGSLFAVVDVIALPTLGGLPPLLSGPRPDSRAFCAPINLAGLPALALPAPLVGGGPIPASIQLVGRPGSEELLCATGLVVEAAAHSL